MLHLVLLSLILLIDPVLAQSEATYSYRGWYTLSQNSAFFRQASSLRPVTDKVAVHQYEGPYAKYFERIPMRSTVRKFFEIGLGCDMGYGPGASSKLWRSYFPQAEIRQADNNADCVAKYQPSLTELEIGAVTGDQADVKTLFSWINQTNAKDDPFDAIVDNGGHTNMQIFNSFDVLFRNALRPGGIYIIEDLQVARSRPYVDGDRQHVMIDVIKGWIEAIVMGYEPSEDDYVPPKFPLPARVRSIDCWPSAFVITKCFDEDKRCK